MRATIITAAGISSVACICWIGSADRLNAQTTTQPAMPLIAAATTAATTEASVPAITWDVAANHVGETVTVTGPVMGTHVTTGGKALVLNIGKDFPDPGRFSIMIKTDENNKASEDTYKDKTVTVTGKIELYKKVPEIKAAVGDVTVSAQ